MELITPQHPDYVEPKEEKRMVIDEYNRLLSEDQIIYDALSESIANDQDSELCELIRMQEKGFNNGVDESLANKRLADKMLAIVEKYCLDIAEGL